MMSYMIKEVKWGVNGGGPFACEVFVSVLFTDGTDNMWLSNYEYDSIPTFYLSKEDIFDYLRNYNEDDELINDGLEERMISSFHDIILEDYDTIFESMKKCNNKDAINLIKAVIAITRCGNEDMGDLIKSLTNVDLSTIEVPTSDVEEDYN